jgi:hypothetical protein
MIRVDEIERELARREAFAAVAAYWAAHPERRPPCEVVSLSAYVPRAKKRRTVPLPAPPGRRTVTP